MTTQRERDMRAITAAQELESRIRMAVLADYPRLCGWLARREAIRRTGPRRDDWAWDMSIRGRARQSRRFLRTAISVAASRISEVYGLGAGAEWATRHGFDLLADTDARASAQTLASLARLRGYGMQ